MLEIAASRTREIEAVAERFGLGSVRAVSAVADSVLNENYRTQTSEGTWFVKFIQKKRTRAVVEAEHRAIGHVRREGVPTPLPREMPGDGTLTSLGGTLVSVFPWASGRVAQRGTISATVAEAMGSVHGMTVRALAAYRDPVLEARGRGETDWDTSKSIAELSRVDDVIRYYPAPPDDQLAAQAALRIQLALLESDAPQPPSDFESLPVQLEHGDFHERNVLFGDDGRVAAVVDWERIRVLPRAFQLVRALDFTGLLAAGTIEEYARGYCQHVRLEQGEATLAVEQWWQSVLHNTWTFTEVFIRGNERVRRFLPEIGPRLERLGNRAYREGIADTIERVVQSSRAGGGN